MPMDQKRSSFAVTCNLLSQYLKGKKGGGGGLGNNFSLGKVLCSSSPASDADGKGKEKPNSSASAQMTIFYAGKVIVIDNLPEEKAMGLVAVAGKAISSTETVTDSTAVDRPKTQHHLTTTTTSPPTDASDLPIARRVSLGRFLEKRKDRVSSNAPYQVNPPSPSSTSGLATPETAMKKAPEWLSLAPNLHQC